MSCHERGSERRGVIITLDYPASVAALPSVWRPCRPACRTRILLHVAACKRPSTVLPHVARMCASLAYRLPFPTLLTPACVLCAALVNSQGRSRSAWSSVPCRQGGSGSMAVGVAIAAGHNSDGGPVAADLCMQQRGGEGGQ